MNIDDLFKAPKVPMGGNKRRMPDAPTPDMLKRMKMDVSSTPVSSMPPPPLPSSSNGNGLSAKARGKTRAVTVEDEDDAEPMDEDADEDESGFAPGNDADYFAEEDDEGRFFGGGLTSEQKTILNIFDKGVGEGGEDGGGAAANDRDELNVTGVRRLLLRFERAVDKNQDQRSKYPDDPSKFIDSEADLDSAIKSLLPLAQSPSLTYPELLKSGAVAKLIGLMSHENADIMIDVVQLIHELLDEDAAAGDDDDDEDGGEGREEAVKALVDTLLEHSILELLVDNLPRLNENEEADRQGVFDLLGIFESMIGINPQLSTHLVSKTTILPWLLKRIEAKTHDGNRGYAAEIIPILVDGRENKLALGKADGIETLLKVLSRYRRKNPSDADETEFMENVFDALCAALTEPENKKHFFDAEGVDLMVLMMKEKKDASPQSIKVLDFAMSGAAGTASCETFVEALGLKTLFAAFMGKAGKKAGKGKKAAAALGAEGPASAISDETGHILGVLSSLFTNLSSESVVRTRLLAKFVESEYEKVDRLLDVRESAAARLAAVDREIDAEKKEMLAAGEEIDEVEADRWYLRRLDGGLYTLQTVDYILAWVCMEDDGILAHAQQMMARKGRSVKDVVEVLKVFKDNIDADDADALMPPSASASEVSILPPQRVILEALIGFLDGVP